MRSSRRSTVNCHPRALSVSGGRSVNVASSVWADLHDGGSDGEVEVLVDRDHRVAASAPQLSADAATTMSRP